MCDLCLDKRSLALVQINRALAADGLPEGAKRKITGIRDWIIEHEHVTPRMMSAIGYWGAAACCVCGGEPVLRYCNTDGYCKKHIGVASKRLRVAYRHADVRSADRLSADKQFDERDKSRRRLGTTRNGGWDGYR